VHLDPRTTAVLTMELQRGVCGPDATFDALRDAVVERGLVATTGRLLRAARQAGAMVVHCTFSLRADRAGTDLDLPLMRAALDDPGYLLEGTPSTELLDGLGPEPGDVVADRHHGVSAFGGTDLGRILHDRGIVHVVVVGVSLNVGVPGTVIEAVNAGYRAVVATDAVVGVPLDYGDRVLRGSLAPIARLADVDTIVEAFTTAGRS
jgi:nicotinamidase-related amidase